MASSTTHSFLRPRTSLPRPLLAALAVLFCAATTLYALAWMYDARHGSPRLVEIGFNRSTDTFFDPLTSSIPVLNVEPGSPADHAGLRAGDQITALNGHTLTSYAYFNKVWSSAHAGDAVDVTVRRPGASHPLTFRAVFRSVEVGREDEGVARTSAREVLGLHPIFFVLVGFIVLFLRLDDRYAWLLALLFAGFVAVPTFNNWALPDQLNAFTSFYRAIFTSLVPSLFYIFFALFPEKSPLERRAPWLKWAALAIAALQIFPGLPYGEPRLPGFVEKAVGFDASNHLRLTLTYSLLFLGLISLLCNRYSAETSAEARRKSRVLVAGTVLGVFPFLSEHILIDFTSYRQQFWIDAVLSLLVLLYPLSFAYAIVKHRVLEIPVLLRRSARYVLVQRSYFLLLFCAAMLTIFLFTHFFSSLFVEYSQFAMALSAAFGVAMVWISGPFVKRGTDHIDRAFFRRSYDARMILQDLGEKIRTAADRRELAALLAQELTQAFHPRSLAIYFSTATAQLVAIGPLVPQGLATLVADAPFLRELTLRGRTWDIPPPGDPEAPQNFLLAPLFPECVVPLLGHDARLVGLLVLGQPLSEEPYSREDQRLLDSVAGQAAVSLENMHLAEQIAERMEQERRVEHEMEIAREVQSHLFPRVKPRLATLAYAGDCLQARQVGGDYYDFWDFGATHLALVLADISGKGISGALLMANLQANLRSRSAVARQDMLNTACQGQWLPGLLKSVNQLFYENTPDDRYATVFFAVYDDTSRRLEYVNCGHNPPLLFRASRSIERLEPTAMVLGLSPDWECSTRSTTLCPNDVLVLYTDGVTEANDAEGNEFGEKRLEAVVRANFSASPDALLHAIQQAVQKYSVGEQFDDLTLVVARGC